MIEDFFNFKEIKRVNKEDIDYIKSGFRIFDESVGGFQRGQVSIWSGLNGCGKTNVLTQQALEYFKQKHKTVIFSGEMPSYSIKNMIYQQFAGSKNLTHHHKVDYYYLANDAKGARLKDIIDDLINDKIFIYNNDRGTKVETVINSIEQLVINKKIHVVILDNLMALDLRGLGGDKNERQKLFIDIISKLAKRLKIHIHVVMHPRKTMGFLRKEDIAGSSDLANMAENVFIVHRNNSDFKKRFREEKGRGPIIDFVLTTDNIIEVCKNRNEGVQDLFVGLKFNRQSKTFSTMVPKMTPQERTYM